MHLYALSMHCVWFMWFPSTLPFLRKIFNNSHISYTNKRSLCCILYAPFFLNSFRNNWNENAWKFFSTYLIPTAISFCLENTFHIPVKYRIVFQNQCAHTHTHLYCLLTKWNFYANVSTITRYSNNTYIVFDTLHTKNHIQISVYRMALVFLLKFSASCNVLFSCGCFCKLAFVKVQCRNWLYVFCLRVA